MSKLIKHLKSLIDKDHVAYNNFILLLETLSSIIELSNGLDFFMFNRNDNKGVIYIDVIDSLGLNLNIIIAASTTHYTLEIYNESTFETIIFMKLPIVMRESLIPAFNYILDKKETL